MAGVRWLILTAAVSGWWIQLMLGTSCPGGTFGDTCSFFCHCTPPCNQTSGVCNGVCDPGWFGGNGQTCQRENVAFYKTASSPPTDHGQKGWTADKAVDGNRDQDVLHNSCFHSHSTAPNPTWTVDLGQPYRIHDVRIYNRAGYPQFNRTAVLTLSNSSSFTPGVTCFTFPSDTVKTNNDVYDVTCNGTGRYFTITNSRGLILCEVEIYVCSPGVFGDSCNQFCHCVQATCDPVSGVCPGTCRPGWQGDRCDTVCLNGSYGQNCNNSCIERRCVGDSPCDHVRGTCISGCEAGWMSEDCRQACPSGSYGQNCSKYCTDRQCAGDSPCDPVQGTCVSGCEPGWMGEDCREACDINHYGVNCDKTCASRHCVGMSSCTSTGDCHRGCETGWTQVDCTEDVRSVQPAGFNASQLAVAVAVAVAVAFVAGAVLGGIVTVVVWRRRNRRLDKTSHPNNVSNAQTERSQASDDVGPGTRTYDSLNVVSYDAKMEGDTYYTITSRKTDLGTGATALTSCDVSDSIAAGTYETLDNTSRGTDGEYSEIGKLK